LYWLVVIVGFAFLGWKEGKSSPSHNAPAESIASSAEREASGKKTSGEGITVATAVREVE
jgi:high-affinity iron transporter